MPARRAGRLGPVLAKLLARSPAQRPTVEETRRRLQRVALPAAESIRIRLSPWEPGDRAGGGTADQCRDLLLGPDGLTRHSGRRTRTVPLTAIREVGVVHGTLRRHLILRLDPEHPRTRDRTLAHHMARGRRLTDASDAFALSLGPAHRPTASDIKAFVQASALVPWCD